MLALGVNYANKIPIAQFSGGKNATKDKKFDPLTSIDSINVEVGNGMSKRQMMIIPVKMAERREMP